MELATPFLGDVRSIKLAQYSSPARHLTPFLPSFLPNQHVARPSPPPSIFIPTPLSPSPKCNLAKRPAPPRPKPQRPTDPARLNGSHPAFTPDSSTFGTGTQALSQQDGSEHRVDIPGDFEPSRTSALPFTPRIPPPPPPARRPAATHRLRRLRKRSAGGTSFLSDELADITEVWASSILLRPPTESNGGDAPSGNLETPGAAAAGLGEELDDSVASRRGSGGSGAVTSSVVLELAARVAGEPVESLGNVDLSRVLESEVGPNGVLTEGVASAVLGELCRAGKGRHALKLFDWLKSRAFLLSTSAHTALIAALARSGPYADAARVLAAMRDAGLSPTVHACTAAMQAQSRAGRWRGALQLLEEMRGMGLKPDTMAYNAVLTACGRAGRVQEVLDVYRAMQDDECRPSTGTRALLMSTFVRAARCDLALELFFDARLAGQTVTPDMQRGLICVASKVGRWPLALDLLDDLLATWTDTSGGDEGPGAVPAEGRSGDAPQPAGTRSYMDASKAARGDAYASFEAPQKAARGDAYASHAACDNVPDGGSPLARERVAERGAATQERVAERGARTAAAAAGSDATGSAWGEVLGAPNSALPFNALISALARAGQWKLALSVYSRMKAFAIPPDHFTWSGLATALARAGEFDRAMALFEHMGEREGLAPTLVVCNCALLACQRKAKWQRALQLLWRMERMGVEADVRSYSMVIRTCELAGQSEAALTVYQRMQKAGCAPNTFTLASLIRILGKSKDWQGAVTIFEDARSKGIPLNAHLFNALLEALLQNRQVAAARMYRVQMRRYRVVEDESTRAILKRAEQREVGWEVEWAEEEREKEKEKERERAREEEMALVESGEGSVENEGGWEGVGVTWDEDQDWEIRRL